MPDSPEAAEQAGHGSQARPGAPGPYGAPPRGYAPDGSGAAEPDEMPTMPPTPAGPGPALRWGAPSDRHPDRHPDRGVGRAPGAKTTPAPMRPLRPARRRSRAYLLLTGGAAVATGAVVVLARLAGPGGGPDQALSSLVATAARAQHLSSAAVAGVCQSPAPGTGGRREAMADLSTAQAMDRSVVVRLSSQREAATMARAGLARVVQDLRQVAASAAVANGDYRQWAADREIAGCYSAPDNDVYFQRARSGGEMSAPMTAALVRQWDAVAARHHLRTWDASQL